MKNYNMTQLQSLNLVDLKKVAAEIELMGRSKMNKATLVSSIAEVVKKNMRASKDVYSEKAEVGLLVAFRVGDVLFTGKIEIIATHYFLCRTKNGTKLSVSKENVIWFKTGKRWPKSIYQELKGL